MEILVQTPASIPCPHCGVFINLRDEYIIDYFNGINVLCPSCSAQIAWWSAFVNIVKEHYIWPNMIFMLIGAEWAIFKTILHPNQVKNIDIATYIPENAKILYLSYGPGSGGLFPIEMHGNTPNRHFIPTSVDLYPMPVGNEPHNETELNISVAWVNHSPDDEAWQNLINAFEAYTISRYESSIIPANVTVELTLNRVLASFLDTVASRKNVKPFLQDGATYGHQLNVLLPALLSFTHAPSLPENIRGLLNGLKNLRNDLAHRGRLDKPLEKDSAAEYLCAALFAFHYLRHIQTILMDRPSSLAQSLYKYALEAI